MQIEREIVAALSNSVVSIGTDVFNDSFKIELKFRE